MGLMVVVSLPVQMREAQSMGKEALADSVRSCESPHPFICELCSCRAHPSQVTVPSVLPTPPFLQPAPCSDAQWDAAGAAVLQMAEETAGLSVTAFSRQEESLPGTSAAAAACVPAAGRLFHSNSLHWLGSAAAAAAAASCRHAALACTACSSPRPMGKGRGWGGGKMHSTNRWWFVATGFCFSGSGAAFQHGGSRLFCVPDAKAWGSGGASSVW